MFFALLAPFSFLLLLVLRWISPPSLTVLVVLRRTFGALVGALVGSPLDVSLGTTLSVGLCEGTSVGIRDKVGSELGTQLGSIETVGLSEGDQSRLARWWTRRLTWGTLRGRLRRFLWWSHGQSRADRWYTRWFLTWAHRGQEGFIKRVGLREREGLALGCALTVGVLVGIALGVESATCIFKKL